ncbi:uncharacterized protein At5g50100, chloroplastic-like [Asterias rubens]|uniref:uncharacterized protein At5g50100, chloroplastic-like n=1 Tax=Asterias rubens TaxID=7604 RepID=UPI0014552F4C|nr:uncharacterized protein At5g50100, chloroplastic-like [Asterias rubens]
MAAKAIIGSTSRFVSKVNNTVLPTNRTSLAGCFYSAVSTENKIDKKYKVLYDGDCPLCMQEMKVVKYLNDKRQTLDLVNIASPDYKPEDNNDISYETAMDVMHVIGPDKQVYTKVDAVHELYSALGARWMVAYMKWPILSTLFDKSYMAFARNRLRWTTGWRSECEDNKCQTPPKTAAKDH